jgi:hypothetical protein
MTSRGLCIVFVVASCLLASPVSAAVRQCRPAVAAVSVGQANEVLAKRAAVVAWIGKASTLGLQFASWRLADQRMVKCVPSPKAKGMFDCVAAATPCTIIQNPNAPGANPGAPPKKRKTKRGAPIDT